VTAQKKLLAIAICVGTAAVGAKAGATATFPSEIEKHLALPAGAVAKIAPPDGCHLCHVNGAVGAQPLTAWGTLMKSYGTVKYQEATVDGALDAIQASSPNLIVDLKSGIDPNNDRDAGASAYLGLVPQYGCGSVSPGAPQGGSAGWLLFAASVAFMRRPGRRTSDAQPAQRRSNGRREGENA
jgi:hypothetical protein